MIGDGSSTMPAEPNRPTVSAGGGRPMTTPHEIEISTPLRIADGPVSTAIPEETVILDARAGRYFALPGVGARVWELLAAPTTLGALVATVTDEYDIDAATCERDLRSLLNDLRSAGLLEVGGDVAP
jgi:hypothetical protein